MTLQLRLSRGETVDKIAVRRGATMGELRAAIWRMTGVPWSKGALARYQYGGKCQRLTVRGRPLPTDDAASIAGCGVVDGDVLQLVEDKTALKYGATYLGVASAEGERQVVRRIVELDDRCVKLRDDWQYTALHWAARCGQAGVIEELVGVAADCEAVNMHGAAAPLHLAASNGWEAAIEALSCGGAVHGAADTGGERPLHWAARNDRSAAACILAEGGAAADDAAYDGSRPLLSAAGNDEEGKVVEELVSVGAEVGRQWPVAVASESKKTAREVLQMAGAENVAASTKDDGDES
jgi:ankyrin repeat protein